VELGAFSRVVPAARHRLASIRALDQRQMRVWPTPKEVDRGAKPPQLERQPVRRNSSMLTPRRSGAAERPIKRQDAFALHRDRGERREPERVASDTAAPPGAPPRT
jgi:hypothetical protein